MITKWAISSWIVISIRVGLISQLYHLTIICWIVLEILTWSLFFLFFMQYSKMFTNHLFLFFIIQTSCSFVWLLSSILLKVELNENLFATIVISLSLFVKIGLFPGHMWGLYIYNSANIPVILALSSFIKVTPLLMLVLWFAGCVSETSKNVLFFWITISYVYVMVNLWVRRNLFSFLFFSGVFHLRNIVLILISGSLHLFTIYYLTYIFILLSFRTLYYHFNINSLQGSYSFSGNVILILHLLRVVGFPPFPLFWYKLLFFYSVWGDNLFAITSSIAIIAVLFIYLLTLFMSIIKGLIKPKNSNIKWMRAFFSIEKCEWRTLIPHFFPLILPSITMVVLV